MRNFATKKFTVMTYLILLCVVAAVSARKFMSNVPDAQQQVKNDSSGYKGSYKKCLICGRSHAGPQENIISGDPVDPPNKYPWMVRIVTDLQMCSGAILDRYHILTAAHCLIMTKNCTKPQQYCKRKPDKIFIQLTSKSKNGIIGPLVKETFIHPQFDLINEAINDIAVLKLKSPITCNAFASPICLPRPNFSVPAKRTLVIAGYGKTVFTPEAVTELEPLTEAKVMAVNVSRCGIDRLKGINYDCVIGREGKTACYGDSGGPLFFSKEEVFYTLGVASRQTSTICDGKHPSVYVKVPNFMKFIQKKTGLVPAQEVKVQGKKGLSKSAALATKHSGKNGGKCNNKRRT